MFACVGGARYWPLTANVGFFRASAEAVTQVVVPWPRERRFLPRKRRRTRAATESPWVRSDYEAFDAALRAHAPYGKVHTKFIIPSGNGEWTTVLDARFPQPDVAYCLEARADLDLGCEFVATCWEPETPSSLAGATFVHFKPGLTVGSTGRRPADRRVVQTSDQDGRWEFDANGPIRAFEEPEFYERRRKSERLPRELLARYAAAVGVPVDDPNWWDGPVTVATASIRPPLRYYRETTWHGMPEWSTIEDLRTLCGYPLDTIPDKLK